MTKEAQKNGQSRTPVPTAKRKAPFCRAPPRIKSPFEQAERAVGDRGVDAVEDQHGVGVCKLVRDAALEIAQVVYLKIEMLRQIGGDRVCKAVLDKRQSGAFCAIGVYADMVEVSAEINRIFISTEQPLHIVSVLVFFLSE